MVRKPEPALRDVSGHGSFLSSCLPNESCGQDQRLGQVHAELLPAVPVFRRERPEPLFRPVLEDDIPDSTLEWPRSQREDAQSFPEALLDDPYHQDTLPKGFQQIGVVGYFELLEGFGRFLIFLSAASFASAARLSLSYRDMLSG